MYSRSGRMVGNGGTVEWSDDDAVKSGSNTEGDVADDLPPVRKEDKKKFFKTPITTLNMKKDPISTILNKIDAEISSLSRSQSSTGTGSTVVHRPSSRSRSPNRHEDELTRSQLERPGPMKAMLSFDNSYSSPGRDSPVLNGDNRINGMAEIYSDANNDNEDIHRRKGNSDLDSVSAHDVDEKFKQILRKRTGYQDNSRTVGPNDFDKTEDSNKKYQDSLVFSSDDTVEYKSDADESSSDTEKAGKGEDSLLWDYFDTVPKSASGFKEDENKSHDDRSPRQNDDRSPRQNGDEPDHKSFIDRLRPKRSKSSPPVYNKSTNNQHISPYQSLRKPNYVSDAESVRTEDFEFRFKDLIVNQMDSETDFTDNDPLHAKVKEILQVTLPYRKNDRARTRSETAINLRDRRKDEMNGNGHLSPRETQNRLRDRRKELMSEAQSSPREPDNQIINDVMSSSPREGRIKDRQIENSDGQPRDLNNKRRQSSIDLKYFPTNSRGSPSQSRIFSTRSSTYDETDSLSTDSKFSRQSSFDGFNQQMSSRGSLSTFSSSGLSHSASQDENSELQTSWSSIDGSDSHPVSIQYNPLLEKLYEDAESLSLLPKHSIQMSPMQNKLRGNPQRDLILPDEESEEIPFAKYTFNKKPDSISSRSPSEKSSSSKDSRDSFDHSAKRNKYLQTLSNDSVLSNSLTSSHFEPENIYTGSSPAKRPPQIPNQCVPKNTTNEKMMYQTSLMHGYPQQPNFQLALHSNPVYFPQMPLQAPPPDQMLMGLGFGDDMDNFLPARFAQDWRQKILKKQQEMFVKAQQQMYYQSQPDMSQSSEQVSSESSPEMTDSTRSSCFSLLSRPDLKSKNYFVNSTKQTNQEDRIASERQSSIEKLRDLLQADSLISSVNMDRSQIDVMRDREAENREKAMNTKRKQFARARQKSLPIYLETLNEEDECSSVKSRLMSARLYQDSHSEDSTKSPSENSTSGQSVSSSTRGSLSESIFTDCDVNDYKIAAVKASENEGKNWYIGEIIQSVPSILVENGVSNESLEVDEILGNSQSRESGLHVEPAMVSVVLNDAYSKDKITSNLSHLKPFFVSSDIDDVHSRRRLSSSLSISPMPSSPVTVIEVGLDNQNDSLDCVTDSVDNDDCNHNNHHHMDSTMFSNTLDEKINHNYRTSSEINTKTNNGMIERDHGEVDSQPCQKKFVSHVTHVSENNALLIEIPSTEYNDMCIQADDGSLSPIIRFSDYEYLFQKLVNVDEDNIFYLAKDCGTQYETQPGNNSIDSDKMDSFFDISPAASSSRRHSIVNDVCNVQRVQNTFCKDVDVQTVDTDKYIQEKGVQTDVDDSKTVQTTESSTSTSSYITRCHCPCNISRSDSDSSSTSDIQMSLQATIDRLEKKTRKYRALYGKKD